MVVIESRHVMDKIRKTCPVQITGSLDRITILPPKSWDKICGVIRFETSEGEQSIDAHWYINVMPEITELVIRYPVCGEIISVEL